MIIRLKDKHKFDILDFLSNYNDEFEEGYITINKQRIFLKNKLNLIVKFLKYQEIYGLYYGDLKGLMIIFREKGFRPYLKILSDKENYNEDFIRFLRWNFMGTNLFCKLKKENPLIKQLARCGFFRIGDRGREILLTKKAIKQLNKIKPKDEVGEKNANNYRKNS